MKNQRAEAAQKSGEATDTKGEEKEERVINLRPLTMEDFELAKNQVILLSFCLWSTQTEIAQE